MMSEKITKAAGLLIGGEESAQVMEAAEAVLEDDPTGSQSFGEDRHAMEEEFFEGQLRDAPTGTSESDESLAPVCSAAGPVFLQ